MVKSATDRHHLTVITCNPPTQHIEMACQRILSKSHFSRVHVIQGRTDRGKSAMELPKCPDLCSLMSQQHRHRAFAQFRLSGLISALLCCRGGLLCFWCLHQPISPSISTQFRSGGAARLPKYQKFGGLQGGSCTLKDIHSPDHDLP